MNENPITVTTLPEDTCYPPTVQALVNLVAEYSRVEIDGNPAEYSISDEALPADASSQVWFQTTAEGLPRVARLYINGQWKEFAQLSQGDMVLVASTSTIVAPWGENGFTYTFGDTGLPFYAPPISPLPPEGLKYKRYVGYWSNKILTPSPSTPATPTFSNLSSTSFTVNWTRDEASYILNFKLDVSISSSFASFVVENQTVNGTSQLVTGLSPSTTYYARVRAFNYAGTSSSSSTGSQATSA